ncbi:flagellar hook-associated protein 2 [Robertmurraya massiliosenegalensis]|uniref:flagellar hook-associated protein 2 n=1 Tax=Robertmurraya TaxID=2837507 RepID=UPI0039A54766
MVNSIRFSGIASGMDTQSIVDSLMKAQRIPLDKIYQKKQLLEWKRDDYRDMNLLLKELDTFIFDGVYKQSKMMTKSVTSSNSDFVTAIAGPDASNVNYKIENVKLATAARKQSENAISSAGNQIDSAKSLWSQKDKLANSQFDWKSEEKKVSITIPENGGREFRLTSFAVEEGSTISIGGENFTVKTSSEGALTENEVFIDTTTGKMVLGKDLEAGPKDVKYTSHYLEFDVKTYNEKGEAQYKNFKFDGTTTLDNMFLTINKSDAGVNMFYDSGSDKVVAMRSLTGDFNPTGNEIEFVNATRDENGKVTSETSHSFFTSSLSLGDDEVGTGTDATFKINGLETSRKNNAFTINGVSFTLKKDSVEGESATIGIQTDTEGIVNTITDFVNKYNEVIDKINGKLTEERYTSYAPLSDEEKSSLSEDEVTRWEEKAKSGMLRRDSILSNALDTLRTNMYTQVTANDVTRTDENYNQLAEIGITTTKNYLERGKLEIDAEKLKAAIEDNPDAVYQLFMADGPTSSEQGLARRVRTTISSTIRSIEDRAGNSFKTAQSYTMGKQLLDFEDQIQRFEDRLATAEDRYWSQFNAMEKAMQELNNQSNTLMSYLGMGSQ